MSKQQTCHKSSTCTNSPGSYSCECENGLSTNPKERGALMSMSAKKSPMSVALTLSASISPAPSHVSAIRVFVAMATFVKTSTNAFCGCTNAHRKPSAKTRLAGIFVTGNSTKANDIQRILFARSLATSALRVSTTTASLSASVMTVSMAMGLATAEMSTSA